MDGAMSAASNVSPGCTSGALAASLAALLSAKVARLEPHSSGGGGANQKTW